MGNPEHFKILKQGVEVWNQWRRENSSLKPDLKRSHLSGKNLGQVNFIEADLRESDLSWCNLVKSDLKDSDLRGTNFATANLEEADLRGANLRKADLFGAVLTKAKLQDAALIGTNLEWVNMQRANFSHASIGEVSFFEADLTATNLERSFLRKVSFSKTKLSHTIFTKAKLALVTFGNVDLSLAQGLATIQHRGPSTIGLDTIYLSKGKIPISFLRGAGIPDTFIEYMKSLTDKAFEYYSCFISYSSKDQDFAQQLYADLQNKGVRCWFAPEDMKVGDKIRQRLDQSIRIHDKLLLILSENSIGSDWVGDEVESAYEEERKRGKTVLFPVRIDDAVMDTDQAWAAKLRRSRHIGDFTNWKDHNAYNKAFDRLLRDLKAED